MNKIRCFLELTRARNSVIGIALILMLNTAPAVFAMTTPTATDFGYSVYDIAINNILKGPVGFVSVGICFVLGSVLLLRNQPFMSVACFIGGGVMYNADSMVTTLGMLI
ncbi:MAG: hypothetical protein GY757_52990 [bacterium]|nr:hypothetical protein [bacterium]